MQSRLGDCMINRAKKLISQMIAGVLKCPIEQVRAVLGEAAQ
jgi:hypothetical protein